MIKFSLLEYILEIYAKAGYTPSEMYRLGFLSARTMRWLEMRAELQKTMQEHGCSVYRASLILGKTPTEHRRYQEVGAWAGLTRSYQFAQFRAD